MEIKNLGPPDFPYEDHHHFKDIIRMEMALLYNGVRTGKSISELDFHFKELQGFIEHFKNPFLEKAFHHLKYLLHHNYPITESTDREVIKEVNNCFNTIDQETLY